MRLLGDVIIELVELLHDRGSLLGGTRRPGPCYTLYARACKGCNVPSLNCCLIACRVLDVPVPEIVLQRAGIAPMVEELITIAMPQPMRSIAARLSMTPTQNMKP